MEIDIQKAHKDLANIRAEKVKLQERIENLSGTELQLVAFINLTQLYEIGAEQDESFLGTVAEAGIASNGKPERLKVVPRGFESKKQYTIIAEAVAGVFQPGEIVSGRTALERIGEDVRSKLTMPSGVGRFSPVHLVANLLMREASPGGILKRVGPGQYEVLPNAKQIVHDRLAAEFANSRANTGN